MLPYLIQWRSFEQRMLFDFDIQRNPALLNQPDMSAEASFHFWCLSISRIITALSKTNPARPKTCISDLLSAADFL